MFFVQSLTEKLAKVEAALKEAQADEKVQSLQEKLALLESAQKEANAERSSNRKSMCRLQMERDEARSLMSKLKVSPKMEK